MSQLRASVLSFEQLKPLYVQDKDFGELYKECQKHPKGEFLIHEGFLFRGTQLCVPQGGTWELLIREVHGGSLASHFGERKSLMMLKEHYFWPCMQKDVHEVIKRCAICHMAKSHTLPQCLYTPLSVANHP